MSWQAGDWLAAARAKSKVLPALLLSRQCSACSICLALTPLNPPPPLPPPPAHRSVPGERFVLRFQLTDEFEEDICSTDPWCAADWFMLRVLTA